MLVAFGFMYLLHQRQLTEYSTGVLWKRQGGYDIDPFGGDLSIPDESTRAGPVTRTALVLIIVLVVLFVGVCLTVVCCIYHCSRRTASRTISGGGGNG